jgi:hypothetical protein
MKKLPRLCAVILYLFALSLSALAGTALSPATPASLEPPAGETLALTLTGRGVQIYKCCAIPGTPSKCEWQLKGPESGLFDASGRKVGRHFAGPT